MARAILARLDHDDKALAADRARLGEVRASRAAQAQKYFAEHAPIWDETRRLHAPEAEVEAAGAKCRLPVRLSPSLPERTAAVPVGLPGSALLGVALPVPCRITIGGAK